MVVSANVVTGNGTGKRGAKQPISADVASYQDDKTYTISAVTVPGPLYKGAILYVVEHKPGYVENGVLKTGALSIASRYAYASTFAPDFDIEAYEQKIVDERNAARKTGGGTRSEGVKSKASALDKLLDMDDDDMADVFKRIAEMKAQGLSKAEIAAALGQS